jgi:hypothetical protein
VAADIRINNDDIEITGGSLVVHGTGNIFAGGTGNDGDLVLKSSDGQERIRLDAAGGNAWLGGNGLGGDIVLFAPGGDNTTLAQATIHLDGGAGNIFAGGNGFDGDLVLRSSAGQDRIRLDGDGGNAWIGGNGVDGDVMLFAASGNNTTLDQATIHLRGSDGKIVLANGDCAEEFDLLDGDSIAAGSIVVIGDDERLALATTAYDRRVAGVVTGAGSYKPGIVLDHRPGSAPRPTVALIGKVYCLVDSTFGDIAVGDLLVSSPTPGHAMRASDPALTSGAVLGKALRKWSGTRGLIPILVTLQ